MTRRLITVAGRSWITLEGLAECYDVSLTFVVEVYEFGLLGDGLAVDDGIAVAVTMLDRMAEACRLHRLLGVETAALALLLDESGPIWEAAPRASDPT